MAEIAPLKKIEDTTFPNQKKIPDIPCSIYFRVIISLPENGSARAHNCTLLGCSLHFIISVYQSPIGVLGFGFRIYRV